jgi:YD repeat-containing protein
MNSIIVRAGSACHITKLALTATIVLAITFTLTACGGDGGNVKLLETITDDNGNVQRLEYDSQNRLVKIDDKTITYSDNLIIAGTQKFIINGNTVTVEDDTYISKFFIDKYGQIAGYGEDGKNTYKDGNLISENSEYDNTYYSYDNKKSPFSKSNTPKWLIRSLFHKYESKNNVVSSEGSYEGEGEISTSYKYEYDSDGFPISVKETEKHSAIDGITTRTTRFTYTLTSRDDKEANEKAAAEAYQKAKADAEAEAAAAAARAIAEAAAAAEEEKPKFFECEYDNSDAGAEEEKWTMGVTNNNCTRIVGNLSKKHTHAVFGSKIYKIKYIGKKKERREPRDMEFYFESYETVCGAEYELIGHKEEWCGTFLLYNDSDKWGGVTDNIVFKDFGENTPKVGKDDIAAMEKLQNGRKIILSEVIADFSIEGKSNRLMLARYKNSKEDGLFQIVLRDHNNDYFTADFPSGLDEDGQPNWRADMGDEIGSWRLYFVGSVAEGLYLVTEWCAAEGCGVTPFVAKDGKLEDWSGKSITMR